MLIGGRAMGEFSEGRVSMPAEVLCDMRGNICCKSGSLQHIPESCSLQKLRERI